MKLINLEKNNKLFRLDLDGSSLFFSYETCIAFTINGKSYMTDEKFSMTTAKHKNFLNKYDNFEIIDKNSFDQKLNFDFKWR